MPSTVILVCGVATHTVSSCPIQTHSRLPPTEKGRERGAASKLTESGKSAWLPGHAHRHVIAIERCHGVVTGCVLASLRLGVRTLHDRVRNFNGPGQGPFEAR
eukprot:3695059-Rhodomonas_salina.3